MRGNTVIVIIIHWGWGFFLKKTDKKPRIHDIFTIKVLSKTQLQSKKKNILNFMYIGEKNVLKKN
jgi:hypothetical protein